jgi:betaine-aldehyde dehydrogenase
MSPNKTFTLPPIRRVLTSFVNGKFLPEPLNKSDIPSSLFHRNILAATNEELCVISSASYDVVEQALVSAKKSQIDWARKTPSERGRILIEAARILKNKTHYVAELEAVDTSRPIGETSMVDVKSATDCLEYFGGSVASQQVGETHRCGPGPESFTYTLREPLGVTVGIGAFNYPLQSAVWKVAPALAFGNSMVFKPSEHTPLTALELAQCLKEAGLPDGVFSVVLGKGSDVGNHLVNSPLVKKISFTGSVNTGIRIAQTAATRLAKVSLELGGKSPLIIFNDADFDKALTGVMIANFYSNGEVCSNGTRVFIHESIYDRFVTELVRRVEKLRVGHPLDPETDFSALVNEDQLNRVLEYIQIGCQEGATLAYGKPQRMNVQDFEQRNISREWAERFNQGAFILPTIFKDCKDHYRIVKEEIFGPVACLLKFSTEEEVIGRAQDTQFGLAGGVFTQDLTRAHRIAHALSVGQFYINNYNLAPVEVPWGGYKNSGLGRENGKAAMDYWTQIKVIHVEMDGIVDPWVHTWKSSGGGNNNNTSNGKL